MNADFIGAGSSLQQHKHFTRSEGCGIQCGFWPPSFLLSFRDSLVKVKAVNPSSQSEQSNLCAAGCATSNTCQRSSHIGHSPFWGRLSYLQQNNNVVPLVSKNQIRLCFSGSPTGTACWIEHKWARCHNCGRLYKTQDCVNQGDILIVTVLYENV